MYTNSKYVVQLRKQCSTKADIFVSYYVSHTQPSSSDANVINKYRHSWMYAETQESKLKLHEKMDINTLGQCAMIFIVPVGRPIDLNMTLYFGDSHIT